MGENLKKAAIFWDYENVPFSSINVFHQSTYEHFYLISADGDFSALLMDLKNKDIIISVIARKKTLSKDLSQYCSEVFYLTSKGNIFKSEVKKREELIDLLKESMDDAQKALDVLIHKSLNKDIQIYTFNEWKNAYLSLEKYKISPLILNQIISFEEFFKIFIRFKGYGNDAQYKYICKHDTEENLKIEDQEDEIQIPNAIKISTPIREVPKIGLKELIKEFISDKVIKDETSLKSVKREETEQVSPTENYVISDGIKIEVKKYQKTIAQAFLQLTENLKSPGEIKLTNLNSKLCELLNISPALKIYKKMGFSSFTKAVEATKGQFGRKIEIVKDAIKI